AGLAPLAAAAPRGRHRRACRPRRARAHPAQRGGGRAQAARRRLALERRRARAARRRRAHRTAHWWPATGHPAPHHEDRRVARPAAHRGRRRHLARRRPRRPWLAAAEGGLPARRAGEVGLSAAGEARAALRPRAIFGTLRALRLDQRLEKPFGVTVRGTLAEALFDPRFTGEADFEGVEPRLYAPESPVTRASGHAAFTNSTLAELNATAKGRIEVEDWGTMDVDGRLARDGDTWRVETLTVKRPDARGHLTWVGDFVFATDQPARFAGRAEWVQMTWPIDARDPAVSSSSGTARAEGNVDDYRLVVDGTFAFPNFPAGRWQGTARGNRAQLVAETVEGRVLGGRVAGSARVHWKPSVTWSINATAYGIDPHATWSVVPAALSGGSWRIVGRGDKRAMKVERLRVDTPRGALMATGGFAWEPTFTWHADATTRGISPAALFPEVPQELAGGDWHVIGRGTD